MNVNDIVGQTINAITVLSYIGKRDNKYHSYVCQCACGKKLVRLRQSLVGKSIRKTCGCVRAPVHSDHNGMFKHGKSRSRAHYIWSSMRGRCNNPNNPKFHRYGGRGIKVCDHWADFKNFLADMGEPPLGMSLDRIDVNGHYSPGNCRWATQKTQQNNRGNTRFVEVFGERLTLSAAAEKHGVSKKLFRQRMDRDRRTPEEALL